PSGPAARSERKSVCGPSQPFHHGPHYNPFKADTRRIYSGLTFHGPANSLRRPSLTTRRQVVIQGHKRNVNVGGSLWNALKEIAANKKVSLASLVTQIDDERGHLNLARAIRLFVLDHSRGTAEFNCEDN